MGITRTSLPFEKDYVQIPNAWFRDVSLSRRARGLLGELMTHRVGWHITVAGLQKGGPEGRDAIRNAILELVARGYLVRRQTQGASGRFNEVEYEISDPAAVGFSGTGGVTDDGPADDGLADVGESTTKNIIVKKTIAEEHDQREHDLSPFCSKHANGTEANCGPCGTARVRFARSTAQLKAPTEAEWNAFLTGPAMTRTEQNLAVIARIEASERERGGCDSTGHRFLPNGTCNFCPARQPIEIGAT